MAVSPAVFSYHMWVVLSQAHTCALTEAHDANVRALAAIIRQKTYGVCMVHGNVAPENVLVDKEYLPVGLVGGGSVRLE